MKKTLTGIITALFVIYAGHAAAAADKNRIPHTVSKPSIKKVIKKNKAATCAIPQYTKINNKQILEFSFNPAQTGLDLMIVKDARAVGYFMWKAKQEYGLALRFIIPSTYYDPTTNKSVGKLIKSGKHITHGVYAHGANLVYDLKNKRVMILDNYAEENWTKYDVVIGGLASLVKNYRINLDDTSARDLKPDQILPRVAFGVKKHGTAVIVYYTGTLNDGANIMLKKGCKDAVALDAGNSRFLVFGNLRKRTNPERLLKCVIVGYAMQYK